MELETRRSESPDSFSGIATVCHIQPDNAMKHRLLHRAVLICALFLAASKPASADHVVFRGTTTVRSELLNYLNSSDVTGLFRSSARLQQIGTTSSLGGMGYALYTLDFRTREAFKSTGTFAEGPTIFENLNNRGFNVEVHKQFNARWSEDISGLGGVEDIWNTKAGDLGGRRSLVRLPFAGFSIEAPLSLSGAHTHTTYSNAFGINSNVAAGYAPGRFFRINTSRSIYRLDRRLTDEANDLAGTLADAILVIEDYLDSRGFVIITEDPLPF